jgi:hypothetical protein
MIEPMHADITDEVARFVCLVLKAFDPSRYPHLEDGPEFDAALQRVEHSFAALKHTFQDCLVAGWSAEAAAAVRSAAEHQPASDTNGTRQR